MTGGGIPVSGDVLAHLSHARRRALQILLVGELAGELVWRSTQTLARPQLLVAWQTADWLRAAGLVERVPNDRGHCLALTEAGRQLAKELG